MQGFHCVRGKDNIYTSHILSSELNNQHVSEKNRWVEVQDTVILQKKKKKGHFWLFQVFFKAFYYFTYYLIIKNIYVLFLVAFSCKDMLHFTHKLCNP